MGGSVLPVRALVPRGVFAHLFCSPALEMLSEEVRGRLAQNNPYSVLCVIEEAFAGSTRRLEWLMGEGIVCWREPAYYIYEHQRGGEVFSGVVAGVDLAAVRLLHHEQVFEHKLEEQNRVISTMGLQPYPVMLVVEQEQLLLRVLERARASARLLYSFEDALGERISLYEVDRSLNPVVEAELSQIEEFLIADGHHRVNVLRRARQGGCVLAVLFPAGDVRVGVYLRCAAVDPSRVLATLVEDGGGTVRLTIRSGQEVRVVNGCWRGFVEAMRWLDGRLQELAVQVDILPPLQTGEHSGKVVFEVSPPTIEEIFAVARNGQVTPPKSTWFLPKIELGILMSEL